MFAMDGSKLSSFAVAHWAVHLQSRPKRAWRLADVKRILSALERSRAEVVGIAEIVKGQEAELKDRLELLGYKYSAFALGHKTLFGKLSLGVGVFSKIPFRQVEFGESFTGTGVGQGAGSLIGYFPKWDFYFFVAHLSWFPPRALKQARKLLDFADRFERCAIVGDFNLPLKKFYNPDSVFQAVSDSAITCSTTPIIRSIVSKDFDHILVKGVKAKNFGMIQGLSDHLLIYCDLDEEGVAQKL